MLFWSIPFRPIPLSVLFACCFSISLKAEEIPVILPTPAEIVVSAGQFDVMAETRVYASRALGNETELLIQGIKARTDLQLRKGEMSKNPVPGGIFLNLLDSQAGLGEEEYILTIDSRGAAVGATTPAGVFYGCQTLLQLLPEKKGSAPLPYIEVKDRPQLKWRGFMLDSGRQYQRVETIKGLLDRMAMLKMNRFHWHLTEGLGWRLQIERYPLLTEIGSKVSNNPEAQGFYTKDEVRDIIAYAGKRHIEVVPEIDLPGHSEATLNAYPELGCFGTRPPVGQGFTHHILCGGKETTMKFVLNVLDEVVELFPSKMIHIGGDEAPKNNWRKCPNCQAKISRNGLSGENALQIDFTNRLAAHLAKHGRQAICWDDLVTHPAPGINLAENVAIQWWNFVKDKRKALVDGARQNRMVIASTNYYNYLNFPEKGPWRGYKADRVFDLKTCYTENPSDPLRMSKEERKVLLGMTACLWTDYNLTENLLDERLFPRVFALAEQMWNSGERLPFEEFKRRIDLQRPTLDRLRASTAAPPRQQELNK